MPRYRRLNLLLNATAFIKISYYFILSFKLPKLQFLWIIIGENFRPI